MEDVSGPCALVSILEVPPGAEYELGPVGIAEYTGLEDDSPPSLEEEGIPEMVGREESLPVAVTAGGQSYP